MSTCTESLLGAWPNLPGTGSNPKSVPCAHCCAPWVSVECQWGTSWGQSGPVGVSWGRLGVIIWPTDSVLVVPPYFEGAESISVIGLPQFWSKNKWT